MHRFHSCRRPVTLDWFDVVVPSGIICTAGQCESLRGGLIAIDSGGGMHTADVYQTRCFTASAVGGT